MKFYCVKQKRSLNVFQILKDMGTLKMEDWFFKCVCNECGITKTKFVNQINLEGRQQATGI